MITVKKLFPVSIFRRLLLIIIIPAIIIQCVIFYYFFYRHWEHISRSLANNLINDIQLILHVYTGTVPQQATILTNQTDYLNEILAFENVRIVLQKNTPLEQESRFSRTNYPDTITDHLTFSLRHFDFYYPLKFALKQDLKLHFAMLQAANDQMILQLAYGPDLINLIFYKSMLSYPNIYSFIIISFGLMLLAIITSILFLKKQIEPLHKLAKAVSSFGKGEQKITIKARGAEEIKLTILAFQRMQERITRQVNQRTLMLAGISHDLRTPLTRMKLQLEMLHMTTGIEDLKNDVQEMQHMVNGYLDFVRGSEEEDFRSVKFKHFLQTIINEYHTLNSNLYFTYHFDGRITATIKRNSLKRAIVNFLNNSFKFGTKVWVHLGQRNDHILITIKDNGIGIPDPEKEKIFRAFYRTDTSRNLDQGGTGLGMTIAKDIIVSHGGKLELSDNHPHGLVITIYLPI